MSNIKRVPRARSEQPVKKKTRKARIQYFDYSLLAVIIFLMCFGLVMLFSASSYGAMVKFGDSMYFFKRQLIFCVLGISVMWFVLQLDYHIYAKYAKKVYWIAIFLMMLVQTPLGVEVNGAKRWLKLPVLPQFQPSEIAKIAVIIFVPIIICQMGKEIHSFNGIVKSLTWGALAAGCVLFLTDNLSTAIIVMGICCILVFVVHPKTAPFMAFIIVGVIAAAVLIIMLSNLIDNVGEVENFRLRRIVVWLDPESYSSDWGYQTLQGLYAIGSGGFFGKGLGNSAQKMVIPEAQNDMILSIICEELGVFGAIIVLTLFGIMLYRLMFIAQNAPDIYGALIATGIFAHIAIQVILNVAVVTNTIPNTGITLPFISYGGTSIIFLMIEMGIALSISKKIKLD